MNAKLPPIYRDCRRLLVHTEDVVRRFARYHKYTVGTDLRQHAFAVMRGVHVALYDAPNQARHVNALVWLVDSYKLTLQLSMDLGAFDKFSGFETAAQLAAAIGKQCGGWCKSVKNAATPMPAQSTASPQGLGAGPQVHTASNGGCVPSPTSLSAHATAARTRTSAHMRAAVNLADLP